MEMVTSDFGMARCRLDGLQRTRQDSGHGNVGWLYVYLEGRAWGWVRTLCMFQLHKCHLSRDNYTVLMKNNGHIYSVRHFQHWKNLDTVFKFMFNPNFQHKNRLRKKRGGRKKSLHPSTVVFNLGCALEFSGKTYKNASAQPKSRPTKSASAALKMKVFLRRF